MALDIKIFHSILAGISHWTIICFLLDSTFGSTGNPALMPFFHRGVWISNGIAHFSIYEEIVCIPFVFFSTSPSFPLLSLHFLHFLITIPDFFFHFFPNCCFLLLFICFDSISLFFYLFVLSFFVFPLIISFLSVCYFSLFEKLYVLYLGIAIYSNLAKYVGRIEIILFGLRLFCLPVGLDKYTWNEALCIS